MTVLAFAVPYHRVSPLYLPRRDLVLDAADSLSLAVTVTESDAPGASLIDLHTGPTFPAFTLTIWQDSTTNMWDYGARPMQIGGVLATVAGFISGSYPGTVNFTIDAGSMSAWPVRASYAIRMDHDLTLSETLAAGTLHVRTSRTGTAALGGFFTLNSSGLGVLA